MKKLRKISLIISLVLFINFAFSYLPVKASSSDSLFASRLGFDNGSVKAISTNISYIIGDITNDGKITVSDAQTAKSMIVGKFSPSELMVKSADIDCDTKITSRDVNYLKKQILGTLTDIPFSYAKGSSVLANRSPYCARISSKNSEYSVRVDMKNVDMSDNKISYIVVNTSNTDFDVITVLGNLESGAYENTAEKKSYNGKTYFRLSDTGNAEIGGILLSFHNSSFADITEIFACANEYSAKWIIDNRINPSVPTMKNLSVTKENERIVLRLDQMTDDDKTNSNGGMYHDFVNTKWPSVAVDENDKLYISASGCRMAHVDPFGATVLITSTDGGKTFSKPRQISNTIMDDRDAGIAYLGDGKLLVSYFTNEAESYLPGGENYNILKLRDYGGSSPSWQASSWDSSGNPVGGINGTYISMVDFIVKNDPSYCTDYASYVVKSEDYGETWSAESYSFNKSGTSRTMRAMLSNYQITTPGYRVPVTSAHGPIKTSEGSVVFAGKVLDNTDQVRDSMAVYASYDDGATWTYRSEINRPVGFGYNNFHELSVTETNDGALLCAIRTQPSYEGKMDITPVGTVYTCFSYDYGRTWTVPAATGIDGTPPHVITLENGDIVMTTGHRTDPRYIYANISTDGGRTWSNSAIVSGSFVNGDDMGYPASAVLSDGTIVTVYYGSYHTGSQADQRSSILSSRWKYILK